MSRRQPPRELLFGPERIDETFDIPSSPPATEENDQLRTPPVENEANLLSTITPAQIHARLLERSSAEHLVAEARKAFEEPLEYMAMTGAKTNLPAVSMEDQASLADEESAEAQLLADIEARPETVSQTIPVGAPDSGDIGVGSEAGNSSQIIPGDHRTSNATSVIPGTTAVNAAATTTYANDSQEVEEVAVAETQASLAAEKPMVGADVSRVQDSFPITEGSQSQTQSTEVESSQIINSQSLEPEDLKLNKQSGSQSHSENSPAQEKESSTVASQAVLSGSQYIGKRKRGRPAKPNIPAKKSKTNSEPDIVVADYVARFSKIPLPDGPGVHESIVVKLPKAQEEAWRENWRKSRERDVRCGSISPSPSDEGVSGNKDGKKKQKATNATTSFKVSALVTRQSSRLSQMSQDSPVVEEQSSQGPPAARKESRRLRNPSIGRGSLAPAPSLSRRSSSRLSLSRGDEIQPAIDTISSSKNRRNKRIFEAVGPQSPIIDNKDDVQVTPARKRRKTDPSTPTTSQSSRQRAFVEVTPGRRQASGVPPIVRRARKALSLEQGEAEDVSEDEDEEEKSVITSFQSQLRTPRANQLAAEAQSPGSVARRILTPRSILNRLKGILADAKQLVFGGQEQREIHNVLFEVTREVMRE
jgi:hypothetical protein